MSLSNVFFPLATLAARHYHRSCSGSRLTEDRRTRVARSRVSTILGAFAIALLSLSSTQVSAQSPAHLIVTPAELKWADVPSLPPGAQLAVIEGSLASTCTFTVRLRFPANYRIPPHWHPAVERITVLSGKFNLGMGTRFDAGLVTPMGPGTVAVMMPQMNHFAWITEDTIVQLHGTGPWGITYLDPLDDPRNAVGKNAPSRPADPVPRTGCLAGL